MPNNSENQCFPEAQSFDFSFYQFAYLMMLFSYFYFSCFSANFKSPFETIEEYVDEMWVGVSCHWEHDINRIVFLVLQPGNWQVLVVLYQHYENTDNDKNEIFMKYK